MNGRKVTMLFPRRASARASSRRKGASLNDYYREQGVEVLAGEMVSGLRVIASGVLTTQSGRGERGGRGGWHRHSAQRS